jgi:hypothetical protein
VSTGSARVRQGLQPSGHRAYLFPAPLSRGRSSADFRETTMEMTVIHARGSSFSEIIKSAARFTITALERYLAPMLDLAIRLWVAKVFFMSGLTKVQSWDTTLSLFEN